MTNSPKIFAVVLTLIFSAAAGYVISGQHGAVIGFLVGAAGICWKYA